MIDFLPPVLMGEARQQQQVVLCWDTRTTQPCAPLVTGVVWEGVCVCACVYGGGHEDVGGCVGQREARDGVGWCVCVCVCVNMKNVCEKVSIYCVCVAGMSIRE